MHPEDKVSSLVDSLLAPFEAALTDRDSALRWCNLGTIDHVSQPQVRTVILRAIDLKRREMLFYTDKRSPKCSEISHQPTITGHYHDPASKRQFRFFGTANLVLTGPIRDAHWHALKPYAKQDYATATAPSSAGTPTNLEELAADNFALIAFRYDALDWLSLSRTGHQRRRIVWSENGVRITELVP